MSRILQDHGDGIRFCCCKFIRLLALTNGFVRCWNYCGPAKENTNVMCPNHRNEMSKVLPQVEGEGGGQVFFISSWANCVNKIHELRAKQIGEICDMQAVINRRLTTILFQVMAPCSLAESVRFLDETSTFLSTVQGTRFGSRCSLLNTLDYTTTLHPRSSQS